MERAGLCGDMAFEPRAVTVDLNLTQCMLGALHKLRPSFAFYTPDHPNSHAHGVYRSQHSRQNLEALTDR
jgi:hypothetical protein